ncbi:MAG TPA: hypothetical protein VMM36_08095 [Opitutaceae bacterium]|nr:hypothetical protein [Opitutaceae bacterium]
MAEAGYHSHLSLEAVAFVVALPKKGQRRVLSLADRVAKKPFAIGDFRTVDVAGRTIENILLEDYLFSFWVDHASCEVRIFEIIRV